VVVAVEVVFLVCMWSFYSDRILSSSLWRREKSLSDIPHAAATSNAHVADDTNTTTSQKREGKVRVFPWERRLHDESREKHKLEQAQRRALANIGMLKEIPEEYQGPTLIIGGSDGSGTRAFARYMLQLGVPMRIDDKESLDVHGAIMFAGQGWPPLAKAILNATHSANYNLSDLPADTLSTVKQEMQRLKDSFDDWQLKFEQRYFVRQHLNMTILRATDAAIGFKAPVTMLLLPLLKEVFGKIKYLHIVRDGRDVALSTNKSPVLKFYQSMYLDADERMANHSKDSYPVLAMNLWNDWNTQALEWEQAHANDPDFDYLVMRSEDLVDPSRKFETLARLAAFVGSPKTLEELCCISREEEIDMGKSLVSSEVAAGDYKQDARRGGFWGARHRPVPGRLAPGLRQQRRNEELGGGKVMSDGMKVDGEEKHHLLHLYHDFFHGGFENGFANESKEESDEERYVYTSHGRARRGDHRRLSEAAHVSKVHSRYGKWRELLKDDPNLSALLHHEGAKGLATFGYEPPLRFMDANTSPIKDFTCDETVICGEE